MIKKVTHFTLFVLDQDNALEFYTKLGFKVHTDSTMSDGYRWTTVNAPADSNFEIALVPATTEEQRDLVGNQAEDLPLFYLSVDDVDETYQLFRRHSVEVVQEPIDRAWGREALFADLYGNVFGICQAK